MRFGTTEIILLIVLALLLFGGKKLAGLGKTLGTSIREFKKEVKQVDDNETTEAAAQTEEPAVDNVVKN